jgi:hypothetical protein
MSDLRFLKCTEIIVNVGIPWEHIIQSFGLVLPIVIEVEELVLGNEPIKSENTSG